MMGKQKELEMDIDELNSFMSQATRQKTKDVLGLEVRRLQTELSKLIESTKNENSSPKPVSSGISTESKCYDIKLTNYAWDQSDKFFKVYVTLQNVETLPQEAVTCNFTDRSMHLRVLGLENKNYQLLISDLCEEIVPDKSYTKVKPGLIIVYLAKKSPISWTNVTGVEKRIKEAKTATPKYEPDDPADGLMSLMKKIYQDGDDEMKRTIAKVWTESHEKKNSGLDDFSMT